MDKIYLTKEQAISALPKSKLIHTFTNPSGMLVGCDISRKSLISQINNSRENELEIGGDTCKRLKHALVLYRNGRALFIESNMQVIEKLETELA
jgi:hypothetical protein